MGLPLNGAWARFGASCSRFWLTILLVAAALTTPLAVYSQPATTTPPAVDAAQVAIDKQMAQIQVEEASKSPISLTATNATLEEVVAQVQKLLPALKNIEVRKANPVKLTFEVTGAPAGSILQAAAVLAGCDVFFVSDKMMLVPRSVLTVDEKSNWTSWNTLAVDATKVHGSIKMIEKATTDFKAEAGANAETGVPLNSLSHDLQLTVLRLVAYSRQQNNALQKPNPTPDSVVTTAAKGNNYFGLRVTLPEPVHKPGSSRQVRQSYGLLTRVK
jgi:hypothetical protein